MPASRAPRIGQSSRDFWSCEHCSINVESACDIELSALILASNCSFFSTATRYMSSQHDLSSLLSSSNSRMSASEKPLCWACVLLRDSRTGRLARSRQSVGGNQRPLEPGRKFCAPSKGRPVEKPSHVGWALAAPGELPRMAAEPRNRRPGLICDATSTFFRNPAADRSCDRTNSRGVGRMLGGRCHSAGGARMLPR